MFSSQFFFQKPMLGIYSHKKHCTLYLSIFFGQKKTKQSVQARALYDYEAGEVGYLDIKQGDIVKLLKQDGEWWEAELNGKNGLIPSNFVTKLQFFSY